MARNIEIKARVENLDAIAQRVQAIADGLAVEIYQDDTFFHCEQGRLKLRAFADGTGQLIFYQRADTQGPKESFYQLTATPEADALRQTLTLAYGRAGRVTKRRWLMVIGRTRIHLDRVDGLGDFVELEVVLEKDELLDAGADEARRIMAQLGIHESQWVQGAYVDLLSACVGA